MYRLSVTVAPLSRSVSEEGVGEMLLRWGLRWHSGFSFSLQYLVLGFGSRDFAGIYFPRVRYSFPKGDTRSLGIIRIVVEQSWADL